MTDYDAMRLNMVESQIRPNKVTDPRLINAFSALPRERFVPENRAGVAYIDEDLEIAPGRYLTEPAVLARMVEAARVTESDTVLDIGCGTGFSTAVLAHLAGTAIGLEPDAELNARASELMIELGIDNAVIVGGDPASGHPDQAPYDVIVLGGAIDTVPEALLNQLAEGGRLIAVIPNIHVSDRSHAGQATLFLRAEGGIARRPLFDAAIPLLPGFTHEAGFVF